MQSYNLLSEEMQEAGMYLIELLRAALTGQKAKEKPTGVSWENVFTLAKIHKVEAMTAYSLDTLQELPEKEVLKTWKEEKNLTLFKVLHFDLEREEIFGEMEKEGLSYLPLKGILISDYYPEKGMRSMADNDILYGFVERSDKGEYRIVGTNKEEQRKNVEKAQNSMVNIMTGRGYSVENLVGNHDSYHKRPFYNFEMNRRLVSSCSSFEEYYKNPWKRAIKNSENPYSYRFSDEDEYLFILVHAFKHFDGSGCGVRLLSDIYVFLRKKEHSLNWAYVESELELLVLKDFESQVRGLADAIFVENRSLTEEEQTFLDFLLGCGIYGRADVRVMQKVKKIEDDETCSELSAKFRYIKERLFPDEKMMKDYFPFFYGKPYLMPVLLLYRVVKGMLLHPKKLFFEWKSIWRK